MTNNNQLFAEITPNEEANLSGGRGNALAQTFVEVTGRDFNQATAVTDARSNQTEFATLNTAVAIGVGVGLDIHRPF